MPSKTKVIIFAAIVFILIIGFSPFMTLDSGIRCVTDPCPTEVDGGVFKYLELWRTQGEKPVAFDVEYYVPTFWFVLISGLTLGFIFRRRK